MAGGFLFGSAGGRPQPERRECPPLLALHGRGGQGGGLVVQVRLGEEHGRDLLAQQVAVRVEEILLGVDGADHGVVGVGIGAGWGQAPAGLVGRVAGLDGLLFEW